MVILCYPQKQQIKNKQSPCWLTWERLFVLQEGFHDKQQDQALLRNEAKSWEMQHKCGLSPLAIQEINKSREKVNWDKEKVGIKGPSALEKPNQRWCSFLKVHRIFLNSLFPPQNLPPTLFWPLPPLPTNAFILSLQGTKAHPCQYTIHKNPSAGKILTVPSFPNPPMCPSNPVPPWLDPKITPHKSLLDIPGLSTQCAAWAQTVWSYLTPLVSLLAMLGSWDTVTGQMTPNAVADVYVVGAQQIFWMCSLIPSPWVFLDHSLSRISEYPLQCPIDSSGLSFPTLHPWP